MASIDVFVQSGGTSGPPGPGWISGAGAPVNNVTGLDGYFYLDTNSPGIYYGPRTSGVWGSAHSFGVPLDHIAAANPSTSNDNTQGYVPGSLWTNSTTKTIFVCSDTTTNAAVWTPVLPVGIAAGTVAAGNDSRIVNALQNGVAAGGDLSGTLPDPTVAKVNGTSVPAAPTANQLLMASSGTASTWKIPPWLAPSTGWLSGGNMTINGGNPAAFDVPASVGYIVDAVTDPVNPVVTTVNLPATTHIISGADLTRAVNWWMVDSSGNIFSVGSSEPTDVQRRQYLQLGPTGAALTPSYSIISTLPAPVKMVQQYNQFQDLINNLGPFAISGNQITGNANLTFGISTGPTFFPNFSAATTPRDPHIVNTPSGMNPAQFRYSTRVSGSENGSLITAFDPTHYDVGGVVTLVGGGANTATIQRVWLFGTGTIGTNLVVQYGQNTYASLAAAQAALGSSNYVVNPDFVNVGALLGWIITTRVCASLTDTANCVIVQAGKFATP